MNVLKNLRRTFVLLVLLGLMLSLTVIREGNCVRAHNGNENAMPASSPSLITSDAVVIKWNEIAVTTIGSTAPFPSGRFMAIVHLAVFEAVNSISREYEPYLDTLSAPQGASTEAAAVAAAHGVLKAYFGATQGAFLDQQRADSLAAIPDGQSKIDGIAVGEAAAAAMVANRTNDGSAPLQSHTPQNSDPYEWQPTPNCTSGTFRNWPNVKPFGIESSSQFRADPPPKLTSGTYTRDFNEIQAMGDMNSSLRSQDRTDVAKIYAALPPHNGWNSVLRQIASSRQDDITRTARIAALLNMSLADSHFTVFESKYFYRTWRPVTAITRADEDGNWKTMPSSFTPLIATPCFPGYPSAHGAGGGAALEVLERAYGRHHSVTLSQASVPGVLLHYTDIRDIINDVSDARVFGGIHFRSDQDAAERLGRDVGRYNDHNKLRPLHGDDDSQLP